MEDNRNKKSLATGLDALLGAQPQPQEQTQAQGTNARRDYWKESLSNPDLIGLPVVQEKHYIQKEKGGKVTIGMRFPEELMQLCRSVAWWDRKSVSELFVEAVTEYLQKWEKKPLK